MAMKQRVSAAYEAMQREYAAKLADHEAPRLGRSDREIPLWPCVDESAYVRGACDSHAPQLVSAFGFISLIFGRQSEPATGLNYKETIRLESTRLDIRT